MPHMLWKMMNFLVSTTYKQLGPINNKPLLSLPMNISITEGCQGCERVCLSLKETVKAVKVTPENVLEFVQKDGK